MIVKERQNNLGQNDYGKDGKMIMNNIDVAVRLYVSARDTLCLDLVGYHVE